ncbi:phage portal protein [Rathayibacter sp. SD072]|uniref:phage portal protein n=1 Tax=Rathayibacter sp. SD072 TaxID=2781731 RepID=UPI001A9587A2|nr:phage portal protein [Rathayibacter sp. SD072]MBO0983927.1 phage portal protein [Rathayibacter sp. SD072]
MGLFSGLRAARPDYLSGAIASPWSDGQLSEIVFSDILTDGVEFPMTRAEAEAIPAVAKALNHITAALIQCPLRVHNRDGEMPTQPSWITRTDGLYGTAWRVAKTFEDLALEGASLWLVTRGTERQILTAERCAPDRWKITEGNILVDEKPIRPEEYLYIPSLRPSLLSSAGRTLRGARDIEQSWVNRARMPIAAMEISIEDKDNAPSLEEAKTVVDSYKKQRRSPDGAVVVTPPGVTLKPHGDLQTDLYVEGRNGIRTDIGSFFGIPAGEMDASLATSSLTYQTEQGNRSKFLTFCLPLWMAAIQDRLSQDDVVPAGQRVRFDMSELLALTPIPTGRTVED